MLNDKIRKQKGPSFRVTRKSFSEVRIKLRALKVKEDNCAKNSGRTPREGTVRTKALKVGWQTLGELDPGTEKYQCG